MISYCLQVGLNIRPSWEDKVILCSRVLWSYRWRCCRWPGVSGNVWRSLDDAKHCRGLWQLRRRLLLRVRSQSSDTQLPADYQPTRRTEARCHTRIHADKYAYYCFVDFASKIVVRDWLSFTLLWIRKVLIHRAGWRVGDSGSRCCCCPWN